jgi:hypothetical protein
VHDILVLFGKTNNSRNKKRISRDNNDEIKIVCIGIGDDDDDDDDSYSKFLNVQ